MFPFVSWVFLDGKDKVRNARRKIWNMLVNKTYLKMKTKKQTRQKLAKFQLMSYIYTTKEYVDLSSAKM